MVNWRFGAFPKLPYSTMQQLNLDWILDRIRRFLPDTGTRGQVLTRTKDGAAWMDPEAASGAVSSVNGKTGAVVLTAPDVGALPSSYQAPVTSVNGMTGDVVISGGGAVDSVNGKTGEVVLTAADVGALPESYVPPAAPVQSVNGQTGAIVLTASDIPTTDSTSVQQHITQIEADVSDLAAKEYKRTTLSATTGGTQYQGYYYADASLPIDIGRVISFFVIDATSNRPCFAIHIGGQIRVFSSVASTTVSIAVLFI